MLETLYTECSWWSPECNEIPANKQTRRGGHLFKKSVQEDATEGEYAGCWQCPCRSQPDQSCADECRTAGAFSCCTGNAFAPAKTGLACSIWRPSCVAGFRRRRRQEKYWQCPLLLLHPSACFQRRVILWIRNVQTWVQTTWRNSCIFTRCGRRCGSGRQSRGLAISFEFLFP